MAVFDRLTAWFNNMRCRFVNRRFAPESVLMLLPHCLQNEACKEPVKDDICNCKGCGRCKMKELRSLAERYRVPVCVASGGRKAQNRARDPKIQVILAVACSKELAEGIRAVFPKLVFSVPNSWPFGPCKNTDVDIERVRELLDQLVDTSASPGTTV